MSRTRPLAALLSLVVLAAAARAAPVEVYAAGDIADCRRTSAAQSMALRTAGLVPAGSTVLVPGDTTYGRATTANLEACYEPTWGRHLAGTHVVPGNHDYVDGRSHDFHVYFGDSAGDDGYFARPLGAWLLVGLDSRQTTAGLDRQYAWLAATLERHRDSRCTIAIWHEPLFSSGRHGGSGAHMRRFWALLERHGADVVINGHEHFYESFEPLDASGKASADGLREFVVGTGGAELRQFWRVSFGSRARIARHGVLHLTLDADRYAWEFLDVDGNAWDRGSGACHGRQ